MLTIGNTAHEVQKESQLGNSCAADDDDGKRQATNEPAKGKRHRAGYQNDEPHSRCNRQGILPVAIGGDEKGTESSTAKNQGGVQYYILRAAHTLRGAERSASAVGASRH